MNAPRPTSELAAVAEAADNGSPWEWEGGYPQKIVRVGDVVLVADCYESPDAPSRFAQFIATFDPPTVRALVARITDLEAQVAALTQERDEYAERLAWHRDERDANQLAADGKAAVKQIRNSIGFALAEKNIPREPTWTLLMPQALDNLDAALDELVGRITDLEARLDGEIARAEARLERAEAAEAEVARLEQEREGYKRDFLAARERSEIQETRLRMLQEAVSEYLAYPTLAGRRERLELILADLNPDGGSKGFSGGA